MSLANKFLTRLNSINESRRVQFTLPEVIKTLDQSDIDNRLVTYLRSQLKVYSELNFLNGRFTFGDIAYCASGFYDSKNFRLQTRQDMNTKLLDVLSKDVVNLPIAESK